MAHHVPVSVDDSHDPLNRMRAHQIAEGLIGDAFEDAVLGTEITRDRRNRLEEIRRLLLAIIPRERGKTMR